MSRFTQTLSAEEANKYYLGGDPRREVLFWKKVAKAGPDACWEWLAFKAPSGHGKFTYPGGQLASRYSYSLAHGEIPEGLDVLHTCDNASCVNPAHLYLGTDLENHRDRKNRSRNGDRKSFFYMGEVWLIRRLWESGKFTKRLISKIFNCNEGTIGKLVNNPLLIHFTENPK